MKAQWVKTRRCFADFSHLHLSYIHTWFNLCTLSQKLTSPGPDPLGYVSHCISGLRFHVRSCVKFVGQKVHILLMKRVHVEAECLQQFSGNPPAGSPWLHPHQSVHSHTPPCSVQGQSLNLLAFYKNFSVQLFSSYSLLNFQRSSWKLTTDVWKSWTCVDFIAKSAQAKLCKNKDNIPICSSILLSEIPPSAAITLLPKIGVPTETETEKQPSTPSAPAYKKAWATSRRVNRGCHLGDSLGKTVSLWKWCQQWSFDVKRLLCWCLWNVGGDFLRQMSTALPCTVLSICGIKQCPERFSTLNGTVLLSALCVLLPLHVRVNPSVAP